MSAKPTLFSFLLCHSFPAVASKSYITTNYSRRHGKVPVPFALHGRAMVVCVSVPFLFCSVQITLAVCTCSYTVEYHSILPPYCSGNFTQELETSEQLVKRYWMYIERTLSEHWTNLERATLTWRLTQLGSISSTVERRSGRHGLQWLHETKNYILLSARTETTENLQPIGRRRHSSKQVRHTKVYKKIQEHWNYHTKARERGEFKNHTWGKADDPV